jgi:hypothetical protein
MLLFPSTWIFIATAPRGSVIAQNELRIQGAPSFISAVSMALDQLKALDMELYRSLTSREQVVVYYDEDVLVDAIFPRFFSIDGGYLAHGLDGVVARLVYIAFTVSECSRFRYVLRDAASMKQAQQDVIKETRDWLKLHGCAPALYELFGREA